MLTNARRKMSVGLANVTGITSCTRKLVDNARTEDIIVRNIYLIFLYCYVTHFVDELKIQLIIQKDSSNVELLGG